jgi:hypothetical protein
MRAQRNQSLVYGFAYNGMMQLLLYIAEELYVVTRSKSYVTLKLISDVANSKP